jgi:hypothetical protein
MDRVPAAEDAAHVASARFAAPLSSAPDRIEHFLAMRRWRRHRPAYGDGDDARRPREVADRA